MQQMNRNKTKNKKTDREQQNRGKRAKEVDQIMILDTLSY